MQKRHLLLGLCRVDPFSEEIDMALLLFPDRCDERCRSEFVGGSMMSDKYLFVATGFISGKHLFAFTAPRATNSTDRE